MHDGEEVVPGLKGLGFLNREGIKPIAARVGRAMNAEGARWCESRLRSDLVVSEAPEHAKMDRDPKMKFGNIGTAFK